jgi:glycosyltransferase involved in cell wall biosynthesis
MDCVEAGRWLLFGPAVIRHVRGVLARADAAIVRLPSGLGLVACREAMRTGKPWLAEVVGSCWDALWHHGSLRAKAAAWPLDRLNRHHIARAPFALYVSREFLQRRYPCRGQTFACSDVLIERPRPEVLERRLASIRAAGRRRPILGIVGSLDVDYKGHETALRAVALLRSSGRPVTLRCLGAGDPARWRARAAALGITEDLEFTGALPGGDPVRDWMDGLDLYLAPSLQEGLPRALAEAMSRALPAVGARVGGIPELLEDGWIHAPRDHRGLARRIRLLLDDPDQRTAAARRNWEATRDYAPELLDARRAGFLERFRAFAAAPRPPPRTVPRPALATPRHP